MRNQFILDTAKFFALVGFCFFISCSKDIVPIETNSQQNSAPTVQNGRLVFKNTAEFSSTLNKLISFKSEDKIAEWESNLQFNSLRRYNENHPQEKHLSDMDLPVIFSAVLNSDGEYMVNDTIVWFNKGYNYFIPNRDEKLLAEVKLNPTNYKERHKIVLQPITPNLKKNTDQLSVNYTNLGTNSGPDARYQLPWAVNGQTGWWRKTVFELQGFSFNIGGSPYQYFQGVYLRVKLEWWSPSNGWQSGASETQDPVVDVSANLTGFYDYWHGYNYTQTFNYNSSVSLNTTTPHTTYNHDTQLYLFAETRTEFCSSYTVDVYGTISSSVSINGVYQYNSPYSQSSSPGNPLW